MCGCGGKFKPIMGRYSKSNVAARAVARCIFALFLAETAPGTNAAQVRPNHGTAVSWANAAQIIGRIVQPTFRDRRFNLADFGAVGDGKTDCTRAFHDALAKCAESGGGSVIVTAGRYLTGPIHLKSNVKLHMTDGAEIVFKDDPEAYLPPVFVRVGGIELYNYSPLIYAINCTNIAITGPGRLNGNATNWWAWRNRETRDFRKMAAEGVPVEKRVFGTPDAAIRPSFVCLVNCTNVLLEDFTIGSGPNWTIHPLYCENVTVRRLTVSTHGPNNDGLDVDSCSNVLIEHCLFDTGDDCIVLKSGYNEDGWRVGRPTENVVVRYCTFKRGHGGIVIGSEMSGGVSNVFAYDCQFDGTDRAIRIKSTRGRGGVVENIFASNLVALNMKREVVILNMDYAPGDSAGAPGKPPAYRNMQFENVICTGAPVAIAIRGLPDSPIQHVRFANFTVAATTGVVATHAANLVFDRVQLTCTKGPMFELTDTSEITIRESHAPPGTELFLKLNGSNSRHVRVESCNLDNAKNKVVTADGASATAVQFR